MSRRPSPAMLALLEAGISLTDIATKLEVTTAAVSYHLNGHTTDPSAVIEAITELGGPELATKVTDRIKATRAEEVGR